jgi:hypothetical protein
MEIIKGKAVAKGKKQSPKLPVSFEKFPLYSLSLPPAGPAVQIKFT